MVMLVTSSFAATSGWLCFTNTKSTSTTIKFEQCGEMEQTLPSLMYSVLTIDTQHPNVVPTPSWQQYTLGTNIELKQNQYVYFKAGHDSDGKNIPASTTNATFSQSFSEYIHFTSTGAVTVGGNIMSLLDANCEQTTVPKSAFCNLFKDCSNLTIRNLTLPATTVGEDSYYGMFAGCTKITTAPALPATTLGESCYRGMFYGCTSLKTAPVLSATTLVRGCYAAMFNGCTSLETAPELPATSVAFACYYEMFKGCTSLETAPVLPATSLAIECYSGMFEGCTKLNSVAVGFTDWQTKDDATKNWLKGVAASGTFTCDKELNTSTTGESYVPNGWTVNNFPDYLCLTNREGYSGLRLLKWGTTIPAIQYSKDRINWTDYTIGEGETQGEIINLSNADDKVFFKAKNTNATFNTFNSGISFIGWGAFDCSGNIMSLLDETCQQTEVPEYAFYSLFAGMSSIYSAPELPATTLNANCYQMMFYNCSNLTTAPELPATTLAANCYREMFNGCTNLSEVTVGFTDWNTSNGATTNWLSNVAEEGTFRYPSGLDIPATRGASTIPSGWMANCIYGPLCFTAQQADTKVSFEKNEDDGKFINTPSIRYSTDGSTWNDYTFGTEITLAKNGDKVYFSADDYNDTFSEEKAYIHFTAQGKVAASGSIMSLIDENCIEKEVPANAFRRLFLNCSALTTAPQLPATKLSAYCYRNMFDNCFNLTEAPELPAKQLAEGCYFGMFTTCYFTTAPELPATTLADYCYAYMFSNCSQLTTAPVLPAKELKEQCYVGMFRCCSNLSSVTVGFTDWYKDNGSTFEWFEAVAETGTFYCAKELDTTERNISRVPEGWTVSNSPEYICFTAKEGSGEEGKNAVYIMEWGNPNTIPAIQYSTDKINWTDYTFNEGQTYGKMIYLNNMGDKVFFKAKNKNTTFNAENGGISFAGWGKLDCSGNVMSLLDDTYNQAEVPEYAFNDLFAYLNVILYSAPELPATKLNTGCYMNMFDGCSNLTTAPALPATTLADHCYSCMFSGCKSLTSAPNLPATSLRDNCYYHMFNGCSELSEVTVEFTDWKTSINATTDWLKDVKAEGSFYGPADLDEIFDASHIPTGWGRGIYGSSMVTASAQNIAKLIDIIKTGGYSAKFDFDHDQNLDLDDVEAMKCAALGIHYCPTVEIGGVKWATMNLGAYYPLDAGDYYAWGATESYANQKKSYNWITYCGSSELVEQNPLIYDATTLTLKPEYDAAHVQWGGDWRMPTKTDFEKLFKACGCDDPNWYFTPTVGPDTYEPSEKGIYSIGNSLLFIDGSGNKLYLPMVGYYLEQSLQNNTNNLQSGYWASTLNPDSGNDTQMAYGLWQISKNGKYEDVKPISWISRCWGLLIRPVK